MHEIGTTDIQHLTWWINDLLNGMALFRRGDSRNATTCVPYVFPICSRPRPGSIASPGAADVTRRRVGPILGMRMAPTATDAELLVAVPDDVAAFELFYRRFVRRVTAFAATRCSCAEDVADVVAQTFVRLVGAARRYEPDRAEPAAFVLGIAANVTREVQRHGVRHRALVAKLAGRDLLDSDDVERIDAAIDAARQRSQLAAAVAAVPPGEQEMLRLVAEGRTPGQAADELGISPGAGRTRLARVRQRLRRHVSPIQDPGADR
jgi:RNA polymerase sigma factor (sigma-70 family)